MPGRRPLDYASLDDVMPDVDRLLLGHETVGRWTLGQICNHVATSIRLSAEGARITLPGAWLIRKTIGPMLGRRLLRKRRMPEGFRVPTPALLPKSDLDDRAEAEALRATIRLYRPEEAANTNHPIFGHFTPEQWRQFHAIHCAHHLSFAIPTAGAAAHA
jgi:hypothetical protein